MRKKIFTFLLALAASVGMSYAAVDDSGSCGDNVTYSFNGTTGEMVITGTGPMTVFSSGTAPWKNYKADITSVVVEDGVTSVSQYSFGQCTNLTTVVIGNDVETIGQFAFNDCGTSFTSLTLGSSLKSVGMAAFLNAKGITTLTLPDGFETVGDYAFCRLEALETLNIPSSVTSIGTYAFYRCYPLATINCAAVTPPSLGDDAFGDIANKSNIPLNVPNGSVAAYDAAAQWTDFDIHGYDPAPTPAAGIPCTAADRGKVLCTDGSIYATVSEATAASKTAAAVITYVDTENNKGLALALANESGTMDWETAKTTAAAHTPAVSGGTWTLPSKDDWDNMKNAAGDYVALRDCFSGVGGTNIQKGQYWTSTEYDDSGLLFVLNFGTNDGGYFVGLNEDPFSVRACLAFDISAAPAPVVLADCGLGWLNVPEGGVVGTIGHEDEIVLPQVNASLDFIAAFQAHTVTLRLGSTDESVLAVYGFNNFAVNGVGECDVYVVHDEDAVFAYDSAAFHVTVNPEPTPQPADVNITPNVDPDHAGVYYSTFFDSANKYALPAGVEAYIVTTVSGDAMQLQKVADAGQTIPAGAGVILKSSVTPFTLTPSDADAVSVEGNRLEGSDVSIATPDNCYVLAGNDGVGFYHYTASMLNPHKAYIIYTPNSGNQAPRRLRFAFETATGVDHVPSDQVQSTKVIENGVLYIIKNGVKYNAQGQVVK